MAPPALRPTRSKHPAAIAALVFDFAPKLAPGTSLSLNGPTATMDPGVTLEGTPQVKDKTVVLLIGGGVSGNAYTIQCHAPTCSGESHTVEMVLLVRDDA